MRITTILSLVGVLSAGSAAAVVNNEVLTNTATDAQATVEINAAVYSATQIYADTLTATQLMFQIDSAGVVTLDTAGDVLTIVSASANPGWTVVGSQVNGSAQVSVTFQSGADLVVFTADRANDAVTTTVESTRTDSTGGTGTTGDNGTGNGTDGTDGRDGNDGTDGDSDANTSDNGGDNCTGGLITVCVDADADVQVNDD